jgi:hypothetical protein
MLLSPFTSIQEVASVNSIYYSLIKYIILLFYLLKKILFIKNRILLFFLLMSNLFLRNY